MIRATASAGVAFAERMIREGEVYAEAVRRWTEDLRSRHDVAAVHFDDGWIDREKGSLVIPSYAPFVGPITVGSLIAIGFPDKATRLVRVIRIEESLLGGGPRYFFEMVADAG
ncbi:hypothetical protein [Microvirga sp. Mcv34]|uniref:hypothetical protein n=1 Tax=Microvirga sp. Mcv34 TaxID=2926016 RepID=UPI0021C9E87B|nr:hypothetical protein [Microvirga sp. Mcv34]